MQEMPSDLAECRNQLHALTLLLDCSADQLLDRVRELRKELGELALATQTLLVATQTLLDSGGHPEYENDVSAAITMARAALEPRQ